MAIPRQQRQAIIVDARSGSLTTEQEINLSDGPLL
jgi:hypothetical protein